jgi:hypothetical protein
MAQERNERRKNQDSKFADQKTTLSYINGQKEIVRE